MALPGLLTACQKSDDHPPFAEPCSLNCAVVPPISVGGGGAGAPSTIPGSDAGPGTLTGEVVLLADESFVTVSPFTERATVTADGASGSPVSADWDGATPYLLEGVARVATNWVRIEPEHLGREPLLTYQAVATERVAEVNVGLVSSVTLDSIFNAVSRLRSPDSGQVILFFRSAGTGVPIAGLHVTMPQAQEGIYAGPKGWLLDDGTAVTDKSGLVLFGNVEPANSGGTQTVLVTRAAAGSMPATALGQFPVKVVQTAVSIAKVDVQL